MSKPFLILGFITLCLASCSSRLSADPTPVITPPPDSIPVTDDSGAMLAAQPGPLWVLLSGVDEHGLIAEHELALLDQPAATAVSDTLIHTGTAVAVYEIRQNGPQSLRRFYRIQTIAGVTGWISDFYVRRVVYLFNEGGLTVPLYAAPGTQEVARLDNVTPVSLKEPSRADWWIVQTVDGRVTGWVAAGYVKESPEPEFLLNQQHVHPTNR